MLKFNEKRRVTPEYRKARKKSYEKRDLASLHRAGAVENKGISGWKIY